MALNPSSADYSGVLRTVSGWPPEDRIALAQDILRIVQIDLSKPRPRRRTLDRALGLARGAGPPPTDEDVERWIEDHRREKYGT